MIYFDNSSTTEYKPQEVIQSVYDTLKTLPYNAGRSGHSMAIKAATALNDSRLSAANFFDCEPERTIFTYGCTDSLNLAIFGSVQRGCHVVTTAFEHNSVLRPLFKLYSDGIIQLSIVQPDGDGKIHASTVLNEIKKNTCLVAMNSVSNVTGLPLPIEDVGSQLKNEKILFLVDGAQSAGYRKYDYSLFDMYAVAPHKGLHAPQGIGLLTLSEKAKLTPYRLGGTGTSSQSVLQPKDLPEALESGTLPLPNIVALNAAINYTKRNFDVISAKIAMLGRYLFDRLLQIKNVSVYTTDSTAGIIAFNVNSLNSAECANLLDDAGYCVRSGLHCAPLLHKFYRTLNTGMIRASLGVDNTFEQIDSFLNLIEYVSN